MATVYNPYSGSLMGSSSIIDVDGNLFPMGGNSYDSAGIGQFSGEPFSATQPPLSEQQQQERALRVAQERADFDAKRNMIMFALATMIGLVTAFFIAPIFF
jgi:hypothetical protein